MRKVKIECQEEQKDEQHRNPAGDPTDTGYRKI